MITDTAVSSDEVTINAPVELVWQILTDFDSYGDWNGFCPTAINTSLEMGSPVDMMIDLGEGLSRQVEFICRVDENECIAWAMENKPEDPVHAVRSQYLKKLSDTSCTYTSVDDFSGPGAAGMMEHFAAIVEAGFNRCAYDLQKHAEAMYKAQ